MANTPETPDKPADATATPQAPQKPSVPRPVPRAWRHPLRALPSPLSSVRQPEPAWGPARPADNPSK